MLSFEYKSVFCGRCGRTPDFAARFQGAASGSLSIPCVMYNIWRQMHCCMSQVRETLDFAARCQGAGTKPQELRRLQELEAAAGYVPDAEIDAFMKVGLQFLFIS